ncbi:MAG TPA: putative glycoside hydrolase [Actinomycetota bacterium]|nr:putative glycoside hydrolase [Actinomycetota bacterium]
MALHHPRRIPLVAGVALVSALALGSSVHPETPSSTVGLWAIGTDHAASVSSTGYGVVVLNRWDEALIPSIRAAQPGVRILLYQDISSTRSYACRDGVDDVLLPTGVGYCWARAHRPRWFLRDTLGRRVEWRGYEGHWWMDVGRRGYQRRWARRVISALSQGGWDGVMADNAISVPAYYLHPGQQLRRYPTAESYADATESFLSSVGPLVQAAGFEFLPNIGGADLGPDQLSSWLPFTSGVLREFWARYGTGDGPPFTGWDWERMIDQMDAVQGAGKTFLAVTYGDLSNTRLMRYARASFLVGWSGADGALFYRPDAAVDPWAPDWTTSIGDPVGPRVAVGGAWRRDYTDGVAVVNPSTAPQDVPLGGTYFTPEGTPVSTILLPAGTGAVLRAGT